MRKERKHLRNWSLAVTASAAAVALALPAMAAEMTQERLENPGAEPQNWIHVNGNYASHRFSTLDEVTRENVGDLRLVMMVNLAGQVPAVGGRYQVTRLEGTPAAEDGFLYVTDGWGALYKIDTNNGRADIVWKMDPQVDKVFAGDVACCGVDNRGVGMWANQIISVALDGRVFATDKDTGEVTWEHKAADPAYAETLTVAPLVVDNVAIYGTAGAEYGIRGWIEAVNLETGEAAWRTHTAGGNDRDPNEIAKTTWANDTWKTGGGSIWQTGSYDPELHLTYWGTGNAGPDWDPEFRPGDNLYAVSVLAMNPDDGFIKWYFQLTPNDPFDYDEISENPLIDVTINGEPRKIVTHWGRNGFYYAWDRATGEFLYGQAYPNVVTWTDGLDPKTGRPTAYNPDTPLQQYLPGSVGRRGGVPGIQCPAITGGKNWEPSAYNPNLQLHYAPSAEGCSLNWPMAETGRAEAYPGTGTAGNRDRFVGRGPAPEGVVAPEMPLPTTRRSIVAVDVTTGQVVVKKMFGPGAKDWGFLATAGNLLFSGNQLGDFIARDAETLDPIWTFNVGAAILAPPMSYGIGDKQYIAILVGGDSGINQARERPAAAFLTPTNYLMVFTL